MFTVTRKNKLINTTYNSVSYSCYKFPFTNTQILYHGDNVVGSLEKKSKEIYVLKSPTNEELMIIHHSKHMKKKDEAINLRLVFPKTILMKRGLLYKKYHEHTIDTINDIIVFDNNPDINMEKNIQSSKTVQIKWKDDTIYSCKKTNDNTFLVTYLRPINRLHAFAVFLSLTY